MNGRTADDIENETTVSSKSVLSSFSAKAQNICPLICTPCYILYDSLANRQSHKKKFIDGKSYPSTFNS